MALHGCTISPCPICSNPPVMCAIGSPLADADVERIAERVTAMMREQKVAIHVDAHDIGKVVAEQFRRRGRL